MNTNTIVANIPLKSSAEIIGSLEEELNIIVTEAELMEPQRHRESIKQLFQKLVAECLANNNYDNQQQSSFEATQCFGNYPQLYEDATTELQFFRNVKRLMVNCGVSDFGLKDLLNPERKRLRKQLSCVVNFVQFKNARASEIFYEMENEKLQAYQELQEAFAEYTELVEELHTANLSKSQQNHFTTNLKEDCEQIEAEISRVNDHQASLRKAANEIKKKAFQIKNQIATTSIELQEAQADLLKTKQMVVDDPDSLLQKLVDRKQTFESENNSLGLLQSKTELTKRSVANCKTAHSHLTFLTNLLQDVQEKQLLLNTADSDYSKTKTNVELHSKKYQEINLLIKQAKHDLQKNEERLQRLRAQAKDKTYTAQCNLDTVQDELLAVEKERREAIADIEAREKLVRDLEEQIETDQKKAAMEFETILNKYKSMEETMLKELANVSSAISSTGISAC